MTYRGWNADFSPCTIPILGQGRPYLNYLLSFHLFEARDNKDYNRSSMSWAPQSQAIKRYMCKHDDPKKGEFD